LDVNWPLNLEGRPSWKARPGEDTTSEEYTVTEPTSEQEKLDVEEAAPVEEGQTEKRRVVVAEDEALIRLDIVEILKGQGFDVVAEAGNGEEAVELTREHDPDVVLMDVKMPKMDGISAAEAIAKDRIAPVVLLTAFSQKELVDRATEAGAMAYVVKPFTENDLIPAIEVAVSRYEQIKALEGEVSDLKEQFETRKLVERAKSLLITKMGLTEPEAFRWIQKTSMDRRLSMREVAETIVSQVS
jgi:AmiR/NasT family two-component response regulator